MPIFSRVCTLAGLKLSKHGKKKFFEMQKWHPIRPFDVTDLLAMEEKVQSMDYVQKVEYFP
jgi:hypothetical protein